MTTTLSTAESVQVLSMKSYQTKYKVKFEIYTIIFLITYVGPFHNC